MAHVRDGTGVYECIGQRPGPTGELTLHRHGERKTRDLLEHEHTLGLGNHRHIGEAVAVRRSFERSPAA